MFDFNVQLTFFTLLYQFKSYLIESNFSNYSLSKSKILAIDSLELVQMSQTFAKIYPQNIIFTKIMS